MTGIIAFSSFALVLVPGLAPGAPNSGVTAAPGMDVAAEVELRWAVPQRAIFTGEIFPVTLEVSLPKAWLDDHLIQLFPQPFGLPMQLSGFESIRTEAGLELRDPGSQREPSLSPSLSTALDGERVQAAGPFLTGAGDDLRAVFEIRRWGAAPRRGTLTLPAPAAHFAYATAFREDFVRGRVPVDRETVDVVGQMTTLNVLALPEEGRPFEFDGAVGSFTLDVEARPVVARTGEEVTLAVQVHSAGPASAATAATIQASSLRLSRDTAWQETGRTQAGAATLEISLRTAELGAQVLPSVTLAFFDPALSPPAYRLASVEGPEVEVLAARQTPQASTQTSIGAPSGAGDDAPAPSAEPAPSEESDEPRPIPYWTIGVFGLIFGLAVASVIRRQLAFRDARARRDAAQD